MQTWLRYKLLHLQKNNFTFSATSSCQHCENQVITHKNHLVDDDQENEKDIQHIIDWDYKENLFYPFFSFSPFFSTLIICQKI